MSLWTRIFPYSAADAGVPGMSAQTITPTDAGRMLSQLAAEQRALRKAKTDTLRAFVAAGGVSPLGWKA